MKIFVTNALVLIFAVHSFAQISVTSNSLMGWMNITQTIEADTSGSVSVNVGSPGANQTWDFSGFSGQSYSAEYKLFQSQQTPYASDYPAANYAFRVDMSFDGNTGTFYEYFNLTPEKMHSLGSVILYNGEVFGKERDDEVTPLPIAYGNTWQTASADTFEIPGFGSTITKLSEKNTIDAWGTIKLPSGQYSCLRWKTEGTSEQITSIGGMEIPIGSSTYIDYTWIGENSLFLASVTSEENETNPNFTIASGVSWLKGVTGSTAVANDPNSLPDSFRLLDNYPNPFNPSTTISFQLNRSADVSIAVYDVHGRLVQQLAAGSFDAGIHQVTWNGTNAQGELVAGGTYFCKLSAGSQNAIRKMTLLK